MNWQNTLTAALPATVTAPMVAANTNPMAQTILDLIEAGKRFDARTDSFAQGKGATCRDIADKVSHFGSFASQKQADFAAKLIEWSKPRVMAPVAPVAGPAAPVAPVGAMNVGIAVPKLFAVLQKHSKFYVGKLVISRKNQDSLCWLKLEGFDGVIGVIEAPNGVARITVKGARAIVAAGLGAEWLPELLAELEADPLAGAKKYGHLSGRCCSCGRDLTDPASIELGIGPICAAKFG